MLANRNSPLRLGVHCGRLLETGVRMSASVPNPALLLAQPPRCPTKQRDRGQSKRPGNTQKPTRPHSREQRLSEVTPRFPKPWPGAVGVAWGVAAALRQSAPGKSPKKKKKRDHAPAVGTDSPTGRTRAMGPQSIRKQTLLQGWRKQMTGGDTFLLSLPETHIESATLTPHSPTGRQPSCVEKTLRSGLAPAAGHAGRTESSFQHSGSVSCPCLC